MKKPIRNNLFLLGMCIFLFSSPDLHAQIWKKVVDRVGQTAERHVLNTSESVTDKVMTKTESKVSEAAGGGMHREQAAGSNDNHAPGTPAVAGDIRNYKNYDFVPGDKIIFEPDLSREADEELPGRFIIQYGNAEIQSAQREKILHLDKGAHVVITPQMDNDSYLPEQFTIELDMKYDDPGEKFPFNTFAIQLRMPGEKNFSATPPHNLMLVSNTLYEWGDVRASRYKLPEGLGREMLRPGLWHHIAIYIRKNIGKAYIDQYRVAASNNLRTGFGFMAIATDGKCGINIKNIRVAAGGDDKYNKIMTEGKFITHGILFEVNKAAMQPTSAGTLNEICRLMKEHPDLRFEIDGHTDSDGNADTNLALSEARANAVRARLVSMGVDAGRLETKGFGETKPIDTNETAEGKANNRRVEFIKM